jgi:hypothetical protein
VSVLLGKYTFFGIYRSTEDLDDYSGVYAVLNEKGAHLYLIDVGESSRVRTEIEGHHRKRCWNENRKGALAFAVYWTPNLEQHDRKAIERELRDQYSVPCGEPDS